jgi:type II secretory pathway component GspD/PulD (secretin)
VEQLDVEPPQVFIDMNFIITTNSDALDLGLANAGANGLGFRLSGADIIHGMPFDFGGTNEDMASAITGTGFPSPLDTAFGSGTLNFSQTDLLFQWLQRDTSTTIVQAPKLLALDTRRRRSSSASRSATRARPRRPTRTAASRSASRKTRTARSTSASSCW